MTGPVFIVGAGRVGTALARVFRECGLPVEGLWSRSERSAARAAELTGVRGHHGAFPRDVASAEIVFLAVTDPAVPAVAAALLEEGLLRSARVAFHCGGGRPAARALGCLSSPISRGTFHPLLAIASAGQAGQHFPGATVAIEGEDVARATARQIGSAIGAVCVELAADRMSLYHAAAVMASNHSVALWSEAATLLQAAGLTPEAALAGLVPLLRSTVENFATLGGPAALTGPVSRGDVSSIRGHLDALAHAAPGALSAYRSGTAAAVRAARALGDPELGPALDEILSLLDGVE
jgi:predicted short-subunit dehydrogenase-like oxidoreductase (DUF2520 family)